MTDFCNVQAPMTTSRTPEDIWPLARQAMREADQCIDLLAQLYGQTLVVPIGACVNQLSGQLNDTLHRWSGDRQASAATIERLSGELEAVITEKDTIERAREVDANATIAGLQAQVEALEASLLSGARSQHTAKKKIREAQQSKVAVTLQTVADQHSAAA